MGLVLRGYQDNLQFDNSEKVLEEVQVEDPKEEVEESKQKESKKNFFNTIGNNLKDWLKDETDMKDFDDINK